MKVYVQRERCNRRNCAPIRFYMNHVNSRWFKALVGFVFSWLHSIPFRLRQLERGSVSSRPELEAQPLKICKGLLLLTGIRYLILHTNRRSNCFLLAGGSENIYRSLLRLCEWLWVGIIFAFMGMLEEILGRHVLGVLDVDFVEFTLKTQILSCLARCFLCGFLLDRSRLRVFLPFLIVPSTFR